MVEYIERDALMRRIKEIHCAECDSYHGVRCRACWVDDTLDYIDSEPAVDAVPVSELEKLRDYLYSEDLIFARGLVELNKLIAKMGWWARGVE